MTDTARKWVFAGFALAVLANLAILAKVLWPKSDALLATPPSPAAERALATASHPFDPAGNATHRAAAPYPAEFRKLDRRERFDAVVLRGPAPLCVPLVKHFAQTRDFALADLDHAAIIFRRGGDPADPAAIAHAATGDLGSLRPDQRVAVRVGLAERLLWLGATEAAKSQLDAAEAAAPPSAPLLALRASLALERADPASAADFAARATAADPSHPGAWQTKTQALLASGKNSDALSAAAKLLELQPDQPSALYLHARAAHAAGAYSREIASLEKLVALAAGAGAPADGYRAHLAQAYAKRGDPGDAAKALALFDAAAASAELDPAAADQAREAAALIRERLGIPAP